MSFVLFRFFRVCTHISVGVDLTCTRGRNGKGERKKLRGFLASNEFYEY